MNTTPSKIELDKRPANFTRKVEFPMHDGGIGYIDVTYIYRTREEMGEWEQSHRTTTAEEVRKIADSETFWTDLARATTTNDAAQLMQVIAGWGMDAEFNQANVRELCNKYPNAVAAIFERYRAALNEGRLGN